MKSIRIAAVGLLALVLGAANLGCGKASTTASDNQAEILAFSRSLAPIYAGLPHPYDDDWRDRTRPSYSGRPLTYSELVSLQNLRRELVARRKQIMDLNRPNDAVGAVRLEFWFGLMDHINAIDSALSTRQLLADGYWTAVQAAVVHHDKAYAMWADLLDQYGIDASKGHLPSPMQRPMQL